MLFCHPLPDVGEGPGALHQEGPSVSEGAERGKCLLFHIDFACMSSCCMHVIMLHACHHAACMSSCCRHVKLCVVMAVAIVCPAHWHVGDMFAEVSYGDQGLV